MAGRAEQGRQKRAAKARARSKNVRSRNRKGSSGAVARAARKWPVGECWISQSWSEPGSRIQAVFTRAHATGRAAAAMFELDLDQRGLIATSVLLDGDPRRIQAHLVAVSDEDHGMMQVDAELLVKIVRTAGRIASANGTSLPGDWATALQLFGDIRGDTPVEVIAEAEPEPEPRRGMLDAIKARFGRDE